MAETFFSYSAAQTQSIARNFASKLQPGSVLLLMGELGAGKTTFVQGLAWALGAPKEQMVSSPTFALIHEYLLDVPLVHIDLYRLKSSQELDLLALEDYEEQRVILVVEWADRFIDFWSNEAWVIYFGKSGSESRAMTFFENKQEWLTRAGSDLLYESY